MGLLSKASKLAKVAKKVTDTKKSAIRKVFDELPEDVKSEMPSQPDDLSVYGYHGTAKERSADKPFFDINFARKQDQFMGEGFYFTMDPVIAGEYANTRAIDLAPAKESIRGQEALNIMNDPKVDRNLLGSAFTTKTSAATIDISSDGSLTTFDSLKQGKDIYGNAIGEGQSIARFDLSGLEKPYVVKNNKDRLYVKDNIAKIKKQGYDSVLFAEFGDRSKQIMVFPEHMDKIDTTKMATTKRASSKFAEPLEIGTSEFNVKNPDKVLKSHTLEDLNAIDIERSKAGSSAQTAKINVPIEEGAEKSVRLNLNSKIDPDGPLAPFNHLQTIHPVNSKGTPIYSTAESYMPAVTVEKGTFHVNQSKRRKISEEGLKEAAMSVQGKFTSKRNVLDEMDDTVIEVGINPKDKHLFIDMKTGQAVKAFDIATIYRDRVYVKGVEYWKKAEAPNPLSAKGDIPINNQVRYKFADGGLLTTSLTPNRSTMSMNPILKHHYENIATDSAVRNKDGSLSTVKTAIVEIDGKETLIPTVWNGEILEGDRLNEAIDNAVNSGKKWPNIDAENVKAIERLNNLDKLLHQDMKHISREEAQKVLINEFSKKRTLNKDSLKPVFSTTSSEDVMLPKNTNDAIDQPTEKGLLDKFKNSPLKYIKDLNLMGSDKRIELGNTIEFNKGGTPMIQKQMEMFEDGGLKDQGGTVDPMSGNDVPVGSTQKEVRDDIPAQLSEGEFVFPADVVRFIGLEKLMGLRQQAKMGLKKMEDMGQMGNSDEATMPDDMPFGMADLIVMSPEGRQVEMAEGGVVQAATGVNVTPSTRGSTTGVTRTNNVTPTSSNFLAPTTRPLVTGTSNTRPRPNVPTFEDSMGQASITLIQYQNTEGATLMVPHMGGKPIYPVPAGYYEVNADGTPVNPEDVPAAGSGDATTTQPVKPIEVGDGPDRDIIGMVPGSVGSAASLEKALNRELDLLAGAKPTKVEEIFEKLGIVKALKTLDRKFSGEDTNKDATLNRTVNVLNGMIKDKKTNTDKFKNLAGKFIDASKGTTVVVDLPQEIANQNIEMPSLVSSTRTETPAVPSADIIADQTRMQKGQIGGLPPASTSVPSVETELVVPSEGKYNYTIPSVETPSIDTQKMLDAYKDYNPYSTVPPATNYDDPNVIIPPKVEEVVNVLTSGGVKTIDQPTFNELTSNSVDQPGFGIDSTTSFEPPQGSVGGRATQDLGYLQSWNIFDKATRDKADALRELPAAEEARAKAAEEFAREEEARAAAELTAAQQQLDDLQAAEEARAAAAKAKADAEKEQAAIDYTISQPSGGTSYTAPSTPSGGSAGYSGSYNEPGRGDGPDGPDGNGGGGGGSGGGGGGNSGGSAGGGGGPYNKGGLAGKKPKKKSTRKIKKGGLAASKK